MNGRMEKAGGKGSIFVAVLAASFLVFAADAYGKSGRGARVVVTLKDGVQASGELINVRPASILILDAAGRDASFDLAEISNIRVFRRSKALGGVFLGLLAGAGSGLLAGRLATKGEDPCESLGVELIAFTGGAVAGMIIGGIVGGAAGRDLDIQVADVPPPALRVSLQKISKYARIKGDA